MLKKSWAYFVKCAELRSFSRVAQHFGVGQSTISAAVVSLESEYGMKLVERSPGRKQIRLTQAGLLVASELRRFQDQFDRTLREDVRALKAPLRIGCSQAVGLKYLLPLLDDPILGDFALQLYLIPRTSHLEVGLLLGHYDLTVVAGPKEYPGHQNVELGDDLIYFVGLRAKFADIAACASTEEMLKRRNLTERGPFQRQWSEIIAEDRAGYFVDDHDAAKALILAGRAVCDYQLDYFTLAELRRLAISPAPTSYAPRKIRAVFKDLSLAPAKARTVKILTDRLRSAIRAEHKRVRTLLPKHRKF